MKYKIGLIIVLVIAVLQLFNEERAPYKAPNEKDLFAQLDENKALQTLIVKNCYDCHSMQVKYPWYSSVSPLSWWIQDHIDHGREEVNFSEWADYPTDKQQHYAEEAIELVEENEMPLPSYAFIHRHANLSNEDKAAILGFFKMIKEGS